MYTSLPCVAFGTIVSTVNVLESVRHRTGYVLVYLYEKLDCDGARKLRKYLLFADRGKSRLSGTV